MNKPHKLTTPLLALVGCAITQAASGAGVVTLQDRNSTVSIDPYSSNGMYNWVVDGNTVLANQWFWYRTAGQTQEYSINTISAPMVRTIDGDFDAGDEKVLIRYSNALLTIQIEYSLVGGGLGTLTGDIAEQISIRNNSGATLPVSFFQYSDFNLGGSDQVVIDSDLRSATQTTSAGLAVGETVNTPMANLGEAALFGSTFAKLQDNDIDNLNGSLNAGPGNVTWALQWNFNLAASGPGSEVLISKDKQVMNVPEPTISGITAIGGIGLLLLVRRREFRPA